MRRGRFRCIGRRGALAENRLETESSRHCPMYSLPAAFLAAVHLPTMPQKPALLICNSQRVADAAAMRLPIILPERRSPGSPCGGVGDLQERGRGPMEGALRRNDRHRLPRAAPLSAAWAAALSASDRPSGSETGASARGGSSVRMRSDAKWPHMHSRYLRSASPRGIS
jgi:hypothetical protein